MLPVPDPSAPLALGTARASSLISEFVAASCAAARTAAAASAKALVAADG
jgi:hypothetical protein